MCQSPTIEKKGVNQKGKPWHAFFCQNENCKDPNWVYDEQSKPQKPATAPRMGAEAPLKPKTTQDTPLPPELKRASDLTPTDKIQMLWEAITKDMDTILSILHEEIGIDKTDETNEELNDEYNVKLQDENQ